VVQSIITSLWLFSTPPSLQHVDLLPYAELPLEAQLNVDADAAATEYQVLYGHSFATVHRITDNGAQFELHDKTVTHHYVRVIHHAYSHTQLKTYIGKHN
jgi:hypothetical protein